MTSDAHKELDHWQKTYEELCEIRGHIEDRLRENEAERKEIILAALTGDADAQSDLETLNKTAADEERSLADVDEAIKQAEARRKRARRFARIADETERRLAISDLCEKRLVAAADVDVKAAALREAIDRYDDVTAEALTKVPASDDGDRRRLNGFKRLQIAVSRHLGDVFPDLKTGDPRRAPLAELDRDSLGPLLVTPKGARAAAVMKYPVEEDDD